MNKKTKYIYIALVAVVVVVYLTLVFLLFQPENQPSKTNAPQPTPASSAKKIVDSPLEVVKQKADIGTALTEQETELRTQLIDRADKYGLVHGEKSFAIVYLKDHDAFQIRLQSISASDAKQDALSWLNNFGFSNNGICKLPVIFYANPHLINLQTPISLDSNYCK